MIMEGTFKYFLILFFVFLIVYITVKISIGNLLKRAKENSYKAYIPIYTTYVLTDLLDLKKSIFWLSLIPVVGLYYFNIIVKKLLEGFAQDPKESILYVLFPMYKFPELVFKKPRFVLNEYDLTEEFLETQKMLFEKPASELPDKINLVNPNTETAPNLVIAPESYNQDSIVGNVQNSQYDDGVKYNVGGDYSMKNDNNQNVYSGVDNNYFVQGSIPDYNQENVNHMSTDNSNESVFNNQGLELDKRHETYYEAQPMTTEKKNSVVTPIDDGKPKTCPNCGARLSADASVCFLCGRKL